VMSFKKRFSLFLAILILTAPVLHLSGHALSDTGGAVFLDHESHDHERRQHPENRGSGFPGDGHHDNLTEINPRVVKQLFQEIFDGQPVRLLPEMVAEPSFSDILLMPLPSLSDPGRHLFSHPAHAPPV